ncbi:MAG: hypothetical protein HYT73_00225 [Candidatus Aenigmarchaeota archaeon]|nr:hypothetical protein [Candidatus Aenigmarchaeota archaeon]
METLYRLLPGKTRRELQKLDEEGAVGEVKNVAGLSLVERRDYHSDHESGYECWEYVFDRSNARKMGMRSREYLKREVLLRPCVEPRDDSIIAYLGDDFAPWGGRMWRVPTHAGRVVEVVGDDIKVRSKFGNGDVFEHPVNFVPASYGEYAKFVYIEGLFDGY